MAAWSWGASVCEASTVKLPQLKSTLGRFLRKDTYGVRHVSNSSWLCAKDAGESKVTLEPHTQGSGETTELPHTLRAQRGFLGARFKWAVYRVCLSLRDQRRMFLPKEGGPGLGMPVYNYFQRTSLEIRLDSLSD